MPVSGTPIESVQLAFTSGASSVLDFGSMVKRICVMTDGDVYINFDEDADSSCFVLSPGNCQVYMDNINFTKLYAKGVSGSGTVYIIAIR